MIFLILAESGLELVPSNLQKHVSVISHAHKLRKDPSKILLDNSWHFAAMKGIKDEIKRGRPDLVHFCILEATTIPLYKKNKIKIYIHTIDDKVIYFGDNVNIPKSYHRFEGLMEKLFLEKTIEANGNVLLKIKEKSFSDLIDEIKPSKVVGFSTRGKKNSYENTISEMPEDCCLVIGGYQKGHFSDMVQRRIDQLISIGDSSFEAHVVVARILYEYEKTIFM
ncbi:MAG: ribosome biogenesis protein [Thaumarchaeota archaeon]|nr:ribosome biogenesis protein [Nitrososphaerota archaeon]